MLKANRRMQRSMLTCVALLVLSSATIGCELFPESTFELAQDSRLPRWFSLPAGLARSDVSVTMNYYVTPMGRVATFILQDKKNHRLGKIYAKQRGTEPLHLKTFPPTGASGDPAFEVITTNGITEIIEHQKAEPIFYITDDPAVWKALMGVEPPARSPAITPKNPATPPPPHP